MMQKKKQQLRLEALLVSKSFLFKHVLQMANISCYLGWHAEMLTLDYKIGS